MDALAANLAAVRERIAAAATAAGRAPDAVTLIAVTKYARDEWVRGLLDLGVRDLGENRPQQLTERAETFTAQPPVRWHQIGQLQRNKVQKLLPAAFLTHSVDSETLLARIERVAAEEGLVPAVLLQANVSGEDSKSGFTPDALRALWDAGLDRFPHVRVRGLMTMAPAAAPDAVEAVARPVFAGLRTLRDELGGAEALPMLSMGMSGDFEPAIAEGATHVRLGSVLYAGLAEG
ncbi:YggS family pyridoxal phosphate-dependent enzyme [Alienimonas californiensis]|uniref:Pyridoxal phosphate homeostasis protein n=1 Tax=Alienimonas californiensis TaxID=2527989 RepID=A0A517P7A7_9PLAN|nr:YggS family pyridoxal phosphate-dependent enzyme [Alienimonas californiensis]QDT15261.1 Pyridoxal phosphate homeostasis protein [Alienimonas californiensis]